MKKFTNKDLKERIFEYFDEIEHFKINKGFTKATIEQLIELYEGAYKLGYCEAITKVEKICFNEYMKTMYKNEEQL